MSRASFACWLSLAVLPAARADVSLDFDAAAHCAPELRAAYVQGARARFDAAPPGGNRASLIYDGIEQLAWGLDHEQQVVMPIELDDDAIEFQQDVGHATAKRVDRELAEATAALNAAAPACPEREARAGRCVPAPGAVGMPGLDADAMQAQLAQAQAMMAQMDPKMLERAGIDPGQVQDSYRRSQELLEAQARQRRSELVRGLGRRQVAGVECERWERRLDGDLIEAGCDAEPAALALDPRDRRGLEGALRRMQRWSQGFAEIGQRFGADTAPMDQRGITLELTCFEGGREVGRASARLSRTPIDASRFELPSGYRSMADALREQASER
jgi:hypothetical protein